MFICNVHNTRNALVLGAVLLLGGLVHAQEPLPPSTDQVLEWLNATEKRLKTAVADLQSEEPTEGNAKARSSRSWLTSSVRVGEWGGDTRFRMDKGRVKRIEQHAQAEMGYCTESADWGALGQSLTAAVGAEPMVYAASETTGSWQQAALWHRQHATVVVYRTLVLDEAGLPSACAVRVTIQ